jgi:hypothetical protein
MLERCIWIHQFSQLGEKSAQDIADTLLPRGITRIYVKAMDGTDWMRTFYNHPLAPANAVHLGQLSVQFSDVGIQLIPWVVNRFSASEADAHIACGKAANGLVIDFEYKYAGFWQGTDQQAQGYFDKLRRAAAQGLWIAAAPDPRQPGRDYDPSLISGLSAYLPQNYWTDFQRPWQQVMESAIANVESLGPTEPILPYNASAADMQAALAWAEQRGYASVSLWRMGTANAAQLNAFGGDPVTPGTGTSEPSEPLPEDDGSVPATYVERGWDTWPAVAINLESIIHGLIDERDAALAKLDAVEARSVPKRRSK